MQIQGFRKQSCPQSRENVMIKRSGFGDKARFGQSLKYRSFVPLLYVYLQGCGGPDRTGDGLCSCFLARLGWCDGPIERSLLLGVDEPGLIAGLLGCHRGRRSGSDAQCRARLASVLISCYGGC